MKKLLSLTLCLILSFALLAPISAAVPVPPREVKAREVVINVTSATVRVNRMFHLTAYVLPLDAKETWVEWTSSNEEVVIVDAEGTLFGIAPGTAVVTASGPNNKSATCTVTVPSTPLGKLSAEDFPASTFQISEATTTLTASDIAVLVEKELKYNASKQATLTFQNYFSVSAPALKNAALTARNLNGSVQLRFRTIGENNKLEAQLTMNPADAAKLTEAIFPYVTVNAAKTQKTRQVFERIFSAPVAVIQCEQKESFGLPVKFAVALDLTGMQTDNLAFYTYSAATNKYRALPGIAYVIDQNGFLHFTTDVADTILVTDRAHSL